MSHAAPAARPSGHNNCFGTAGGVIGLVHAQIVLFDGFDPLDAIAPYEVLAAGAVVAGADIRAELVTAEGPRLVVGSVGGVAVRATAHFDPLVADLVLVPGAAGPALAQDGSGVVATILDRALTTDLRELLAASMHNPDTTVATVCTGSLLLAKAGLLVGRYAATHHTAMGALAAHGVNPVDARVVDDGDLLTAGGVTSGLDLALHLLERVAGAHAAHTVERLFAHERRGTVWRSTEELPGTI